ncbi:MAG: 23S rRNA (adenine(2503)-C(2))-methyltransferase RlmN [Anaerovoracaceae bacterium]|nr:23S rRNA (adenine(2503)-C(2))-methyltransferase RlmN [Anaerovoracaceae bacterium]
MERLKDMDLRGLTEYMANIGEKPFRAKQLFKWLQSGAGSFGDMTDLSKDLREKLGRDAVIWCLKKEKEQVSRDGTRKYLMETEDGFFVETVFMKYRYGNSVCISSQAGCAMGCRFCASGVNGLERDLTPGEMTDQVLLAEGAAGGSAGHIVIMGTGEPLANFDNVKTFIENTHDPAGRGMSMRNITVSTCGIIPGIKRFTEELPQVNLAVSLHAPNDDVRNEIMPISMRYGIDELLCCCRAHAEKTGRRVTFEYALIKGLNDSDRHLSELAGRLRGMLCHVNLIPLNDVIESGLRGSGRERAEEAKIFLESRGIPCTVRRELGADIDAACGQLRLGKTGAAAH